MNNAVSKCLSDPDIELQTIAGVALNRHCQIKTQGAKPAQIVADAKTRPGMIFGTAADERRRVHNTIVVKDDKLNRIGDLAAYFTGQTQEGFTTGHAAIDGNAKAFKRLPAYRTGTAREEQEIRCHPIG